MERGKWETHRETGRQRSEPEDGKTPGGQSGGRGDESDAHFRYQGRRRASNQREITSVTTMDPPRLGVGSKKSRQVFAPSRDFSRFNS